MTIAPRADRWVAVCWYLLFCNLRGLSGDSVLPIPRLALKAVLWSCLLLAFGIALARNRRLEIRPNVFLALVSLLALATVPTLLVVGGGVDGLLALGRYAMVVAVLWLLSPSMRDGLQFVRYHLQVLCVVLAVVFLGLLVAPRQSLSTPEGLRLHSVLVPLQATAVSSTSGLVVGLAVILAINRMIEVRIASALGVVGVVALLLAKTRMPVAALVLGLAVAVGGQALVMARARRFLVWSAGLAALGVLTLLPAIMAFVRRGQRGDWMSNLTGRDETWDALLAEERGLARRWFGEGLRERGLSGRPIDSTWLGAYYQQGLVGVTIVGIVFLAVFVCAVVRLPSASRSLALFLVTYCVVSSYTASTLGDANEFLLHMFVAAAALIGGDAARPAARAPS